MNPYKPVLVVRVHHQRAYNVAKQEHENRAMRSGNRIALFGPDMAKLHIKMEFRKINDTVQTNGVVVLYFQRS